MRREELKIENGCAGSAGRAWAAVGAPDGRERLGEHLPSAARAARLAAFDRVGGSAVRGRSCPAAAITHLPEVVWAQDPISLVRQVFVPAFCDQPVADVVGVGVEH